MKSTDIQAVLNEIAEALVLGRKKVDEATSERDAESWLMFTLGRICGIAFRAANEEVEVEG